MITNNFNLLVGFWSNTVIYSKPLFDIDSYTIMFSLLEKKNNKFINKIAKVMSSKFLNTLSILEKLVNFPLLINKSF